MCEICHWWLVCSYLVRKTSCRLTIARQSWLRANWKGFVVSYRGIIDLSRSAILTTLCRRNKGWCWIFAIILANPNSFQNFSSVERGWNFQPNVYLKNLNTLHYLVICTTCYCCTVNNLFHTIPNNQQTLLQFINISNTQLVDMQLMMPLIVYATRDWTVWCGEMNSGVACSRNQTVSQTLCVWALLCWKMKNSPRNE